MQNSPFNAQNQSLSRLRSCGLAVLCVALFGVAGCHKQERTNDPQLKPIQDQLDAELPQGTPEVKVLTYLGNRGYPVLDSGEPGTIVTKIRHIDTQTVTPVTARVTFYFDATRKLNTYEMQRVFNDPVPKAEPEPDTTPQPDAQPGTQPTQQ
ncbi:MAG TPA: hypothetical protein VL128_08500 [Candidatus Eisenbacteria bacterium]|nr:hypothetical protein [Candidatus Eisenbacteria bacterium]